MNTILKVIAALAIAVGAFTLGTGTASKAAPSFHCSTHCYSPNSIGGFDCTTDCD
jgi:hypothetical protein